MSSGLRKFLCLYSGGTVIRIMVFFGFLHYVVNICSTIQRNVLPPSSGLSFFKMDAEAKGRSELYGNFCWSLSTGGDKIL
jgi:hypothetical protein